MAPTQEVRRLIAVHELAKHGARRLEASGEKFRYRFAKTERAATKSNPSRVPTMVTLQSINPRLPSGFYPPGSATIDAQYEAPAIIEQNPLEAKINAERHR